eukprot:TRINITY_DN9858_c0_g1_i3.p1 TRINITY_DN9858_c0_g1~~TRINITY_DN9858_c0_g1_i3.p1  ORF type:complete len:103 (+),score=5.60 TRINITY_DN9858_c0_g1_i3:292-600(+)
MNAKALVILRKIVVRNWFADIADALVILLMTVTAYNKGMRHNRRSLPPIYQDRIFQLHFRLKYPYLIQEALLQGRRGYIHDSCLDSRTDSKHGYLSICIYGL